MPGCCVFSVLQGCSPAAYENLLSQSENPKRNSCRALSRSSKLPKALVKEGEGITRAAGEASISLLLFLALHWNTNEIWMAAIFLVKG